MSKRDWSPEQDVDDRSTSPRFGRRRVLRAGAASALVAVAGCLSDDDSDDDTGSGDSNGDNGSDDTDDDASENGTSDEADEDDADDEPDALEDELVAVVDTFIAAAADEDLDAIDEVSHSLNPLNPAQWAEAEGWEFRGGDEDENEDEAAGEYDAEVVDTDGTIDDIMELEGTQFWFDDIDLEDEIGDEDIAMVEITTDDPTENDAVWVLVTEADEWRIFFMAERETVPDDPEDVFEEEIIDEDNDVVEEIDWEYDQETQGEQDGDEDLFGDVEWVQVVFTDDPGIEADRVRAESTIDGGESELYGDEPGSWADSWVNITHHPDGDQVVVTAVQDGEETVVHREHYLPDSDGVDTDD